MATKKWMGSDPEACDICRHIITKCFIDGRTRMGPWAMMCPSCFKSSGTGLGIGKGQKYELKGNEFVKTEG